MLRTALFGIASAMAICLAMLAGFLIQLAAEAARMAPRNEDAAVAVVRHLAEGWQPQRVLEIATPHYAAKAGSGDLLSTLVQMKAAGRMVSAEELAQTGYRKHYEVSAGLVVTATVALVAVFENGKAAIEIELQDRGQGQRISGLRITPMPLPAAPTRSALA
ncbi:MAG: hypothetical protein NW217_05310 [Hyphomicrobiaceae bacterium]|nr:hypothetical protein [Hyphomicrobiaceae bacterium]